MGDSVEMVASTWFAGWHASTQDNPVFGLNDLSWEKYTSVVYSFAITTDDDAHVALEDSDATLLTQFVTLAHKNSVEARLAVGGWGGSQSYSYAVGSAANRTAFANSLLALQSKYNLDGFDFDWEYPGLQGIGCNVVNPDDTANFLTFLKQLRATPKGANLTLSAAVSVKPFADATGSPSTDVSGFASVLDFIEIMNYDVFGSWTDTVGPNAPLNDTCAPAHDQIGSAVSAVNAWTAAGIPAHQIVLGVASYGHSFTVSNQNALTSSGALALYPPFDKSNPPPGDSWNNQGGPDQCGVQQPAGGEYEFWGLVQNGFLQANGSVAPGMDHIFDECSQTDFVYNPKSQIMVAYDSAQAFAAKGDFIVNTGLRGFSMWEAGGDSKDILLDSIRSATGFDGDDESEPPCSTETSKTPVAEPGSLATGSSTPSPLALASSAAPSLYHSLSLSYTGFSCIVILLLSSLCIL
ncbi:glycoside hydrolase [Sistotremastrum suecicum HHB10207 ss-3]|uniref:Glycoside hydrolase n=1 Tax=Sistotremastrum suecicum HHB10207 ss-3 TaxID=1314776 RepID=A0A166GDA0_9AGAM|nr:glycoside hydrolase [Sistotremastrum suecicum HHB10207 ss-3]